MEMAKIVKLRKAEKIEMRRENALNWIRDQQRRAERKTRKVQKICSTTMGLALHNAGLV
jgi:hypothetical protein